MCNNKYSSNSKLVVLPSRFWKVPLQSRHTCKKKTDLLLEKTIFFNPPPRSFRQMYTFLLQCTPSFLSWRWEQWYVGPWCAWWQQQSAWGYTQHYVRVEQSSLDLACTQGSLYTQYFWNGKEERKKKCAITYQIIKNLVFKKGKKRENETDLQLKKITFLARQFYHEYIGCLTGSA